MDLTNLAIIIPTRDRHESLKRCLERLLPYLAAHPECSIVVSDDGDAAKTREALPKEMRDVRVVQGPRRGPAANRNCGASHSSGGLLIFLDDDCVPDLKLPDAYWDAAIHYPEVSVFEGRISAQGIATSCADSAPINETGGYLWSCNFAIRRDLFQRIGGFDERFPFAAVEDVDLHFRVTPHTTVRFVPEARVWHGYERRLGWRIVRHHTLSVLLFLHIHGLKATKKSPAFFLRMALRSLLITVPHHLCVGTLKHPSFLLFRVWANLQLALVLTFWRCHVFLARVFYPPCCTGCESIHVAFAVSSAMEGPASAVDHVQ